MRMWRRRSVMAAAVAVCCLPGAARASSEVDILLDKLVDKGVITASVAQEVRNEIGAEAKQREDQQRTFVKDTAKELVPEWVQNWNWKGDLRLRNEYRDHSGAADRNRQRIRFRYGFEAKANDQLTVGARLATGKATDPVSTNQSFDNSFNHFPVFLDQAYVNYTPEVPGASAVKLSGGQIGNPYWHREQLVWDDDLNFEGANLHLEEHLGPVQLFTNSGLFSLNTDIVHSSALWAMQGGGSIQPFQSGGMGEWLDHMTLTAALAYYDYMNVNGKTGDVTALNNAGGLKGSSAALQDWNLLNPNAALDSQIAGIPFGLYGDWVHNTSAFDDPNGYLLGFKVGKAKKPFDLKQGWEAGYYFEHLEDNATFGAFANSDFGNGGTNHRGNVYWLKLAVLKNSSIGLAVLNTRELGGAKAHIDTYQMDWVTSF